MRAPDWKRYIKLQYFWLYHKISFFLGGDVFFHELNNNCSVWKIKEDINFSVETVEWEFSSEMIQQVIFMSGPIQSVYPLELDSTVRWDVKTSQDMNSSGNIIQQLAKDSRNEVLELQKKK